MNKVFLASLVILATGVFWLSGCASNRIDLKQANQLRVETSSGGSVRVREPLVWQEDGRTVVYGDVERARTGALVGTGHTHVRLQLADTGIVEEQWVPWSPRRIPTRPPRYATYRAIYPWVAPPGSRVRVWVCFDDHGPLPGGRAPTIPPAQ